MRLTHRSPVGRRQQAGTIILNWLQLRANNVKKRGSSSAIIFTAFPFGTCTPEGTPHIPVERYTLFLDNLASAVYYILIGARHGYSRLFTGTGTGTGKGASYAFFVCGEFLKEYDVITSRGHPHTPKSPPASQDGPSQIEPSIKHCVYSARISKQVSHEVGRRRLFPSSPLPPLPTQTRPVGSVRE